MNQKINRKEKDSTQTKKKLALAEDKTISVLITIAQEDDSNIFNLSQNL